MIVCSANRIRGSERAFYVAARNLYVDFDLSCLLRLFIKFSSLYHFYNTIHKDVFYNVYKYFWCLPSNMFPDHRNFPLLKFFKSLFLAPMRNSNQQGSIQTEYYPRWATLNFTLLKSDQILGKLPYFSLIKLNVYSYSE